MMSTSTILIVDFGSQTTHLIGRRLRQLGVTAEFCDPEDILSETSKIKPAGIILSGGPSSVYEEGAPLLDKRIFEKGIPILGICYGWQLMAHTLGGAVQNTAKEYGPERLHVGNDSKLFQRIPKKEFTVFMSHGDTVTKLPKGFKISATTHSVQYCAVEDVARHLYGVQFHPEAHHTQNGLAVLRNFVEDMCGIKIKPYRLNPDKIISDIKEMVGDKKVICAVSGGVDSTVAAFFIGKAIGKNLIPVYVESGLMREGTVDHVQHIFTKLIHTKLTVVQAQKRFLEALKGIDDPEVKRKRIGALYVEIFDEIAKKHKADFLAQGTIYSDVIESKGSKRASHIKSHHNVGGLPAYMRLQLLEPMRQFYKDEVRKLGTMMGLPDDVVMQQPFPGPGYAVRVRGEVTPTRLAQVKLADQIVMHEMKQAGLYNKVFQCFALMTGAFSTAQKGDARAFAEVVGVRAYESQDIMTSTWSYLPREVLAKISSRIVNEVPNVSRVVYDITTKPPATMEWE